MKSVPIKSFSGAYYPAFGLNTERYGVSLRIKFECGKIRTKKLRIQTLFTQWRAWKSAGIKKNSLDLEKNPEYYAQIIFRKSHQISSNSNELLRVMKQIYGMEPFLPPFRASPSKLGIRYKETNTCKNCLVKVLRNAVLSGLIVIY